MWNHDLSRSKVPIIIMYKMVLLTRFLFSCCDKRQTGCHLHQQIIPHPLRCHRTQHSHLKKHEVMKIYSLHVKLNKYLWRYKATSFITTFSLKIYTYFFQILLSLQFRLLWGTYWINIFWLVIKYRTDELCHYFDWAIWRICFMIIIQCLY